MPKLTNDDLSNFKTPAAYTFSGVRAEDLEASEYTLVTIVQDISSSVCSFEQEMTDCLKTILESCKKSPRAANLMVRLVGFNTSVNELHGFRMLSDIDPVEYDIILNIANLNKARSIAIFLNCLRHSTNKSVELE